MKKIFQSHMHGADVGQRLMDCEANEASASVFLLGMRHSLPFGDDKICKKKYLTSH